MCKRLNLFDPEFTPPGLNRWQTSLGFYKHRQVETRARPTKSAPAQRSQVNRPQTQGHHSTIPGDNVEEANSGQERVQISCESLCRILSQRGLGNPQVMHDGDANDTRLDWLTQKQSRTKYIPFYREKLLGKSQIECKSANRRASAFCEQQKAYQIRTASANYKRRFQNLLSNQSSETSDCSDICEGRGEQTESKTYLDNEMVLRITGWIEDCDRAMGPLVLN